MKVTDYITEFLYDQGVRQVFELIGGMITHLVDSIGRDGRIRIVSVHHEQAAAFAAEAAGRITGVPGVALATSGPGATNLLTGIGSCYFDSTPTVFITGQVNRSEQKGALPIRQLGFQETDIVAMVESITKGAWRVQSPEQLPALLREAFQLAVAGRPGPVLLDIPMDVQRAEILPPSLGHVTPIPVALNDAARLTISDLLDDLQQAHRPLVLAGGGIRTAQAIEPFRAVIASSQLPVVHSLMGVDLLPAGHLQRVGLIGSYGNRWANHAIGQSDFLLVLGSRLDIRQTGSDVDFFKGGRTIYHVDCDTGEINNRVRGCWPVVAELQPFLVALEAAVVERSLPDRAAWLQELGDLKGAWPDTSEQEAASGINPNLFMHQLSAFSHQAAMFVVDVGQHQMWAAQSIDVGPEQRFLTSGGMGAMGFALPAAVGGVIASGGRPAVLIAGDGGFQLNIQEMQTVVRNQLPIKMVVMNNHCHGMVRQFQQSYFEERYHSTYWGYSAPDFAQVAGAFGIPAQTIQDPAEVPEALAALWREPQRPFLLQVMIDMTTNAYPKIAFGRPITEMEPQARPIEMEGT
jgi:acetolactate synthase-1/2/3 large subunit